MKVADSGVYDAALDLTDLLRNEEYETHGWWLWSTWYFVGLGLLVTKRYVKKAWLAMHYLHAILGYFTLVVTIVFIAKQIEWEFEDLHQILGTIFLFVVIIGSLSGSATAGTMKMYNGDKDWAEKERVTRIAKIHRYAGYFMLFMGNFTMSSGVGHYFGDVLKDDSRKILGPLNLVTFFGFVILFEAIYRIRNKWSRGHIATPKTVEAMTPADIDAKVKAGRPLVIFDNLVLDINGYERNHPGGKFNITHNYGRDISKFFFGGYNLVQVKGQRPKHHSQAALDIVRTMVVGVIAGQEAIADN